MEHLTPDTQQFIVTVMWWLIGALAVIVVFFGGIIGVGGKFFAGMALKRVDKLEEAVINVGNDMVTGLQGVRDALTSHHNDLSGRIGRLDGRVNVLEFKSEKCEKDVDEIYPRLNKVEQGHAAMAEQVKKIVHPIGKK